MPIGAMRPCLYPGCSKLVKSGRCTKHAKAYTKYTNRPNDPALNNRTWRKLRKLVLARDPICKHCKRVPSVDVDHIVPRKDGGDNSMSNLQGLCKSCHSKKSAKGL